MTRAELLTLAQARAEALAVIESAVAAGAFGCSQKIHDELAHLATAVAFDVWAAA
jgi:hypothetical protein